MPNIVEIIRYRKMLMRANGKRIRTRKKLQRQQEPKAAQLRYQKLLTGMRRTMEKLLREEIFTELPTLSEQMNIELGNIRQDSALRDVFRRYGDLRLKFTKLHPSEETEIELTKVATDIDSKQATEFQKQMKSFLGVELIVPEPFLQASLDDFIISNQELVESLTDSQFDSFQRITSQGIKSGLRVESIRDELLQQLDIAKSKAALLARDQTLKFFGQQNENRQRNVGITEYIWDTSGDVRVRPMHAILHGTLQRWSRPPIVYAGKRGQRRAHPGQDYQCRCQALPKIPEDWLV